MTESKQDGATSLPAALPTLNGIPASAGRLYHRLPGKITATASVKVTEEFSSGMDLVPAAIDAALLIPKPALSIPIASAADRDRDPPLP